MKLSISLGEEDVAFLDRFAAEAKISSRSAVLQRAIELLRASELEASYQAAWDEWAEEEADAWESTVGDGVTTQATH
ncbi:ribbon-helix-helix domain-containing protein [Amycolatopsis pigmentata]|uniref:Ribbon-helix-helix domain-containing protein n=1 Tax=Amycolatopsis pigmentata TaxID=450801 RepID=A0ABW5FWY1_9PSEU